MIGKKFLSSFKKNRTYIEFLRLSEFSDINFGTISGYPKFALDLLQYITNIDVEAHYKQKALDKKRQALLDAGLDVRKKYFYLFLAWYVFYFR